MASTMRASSSGRSVQRSSSSSSRAVAAPRAPIAAGRAATTPAASAAGRRALVVAAAFNPPTVADTKAKFITNYTRPIPALYNTVIQELLVQQHFIRHSVNYKYNAVYALGFVSVFDQILDGFDVGERDKIFSAYVQSLGEDAAQYRADAELLESQARGLSGPDGLVPDASGNELQQALAQVAASTQADKFAYNRFFAVGLFRLLELTGAKEPAALEKLVTAVGVKPASVNKDLLLYKGVLSKLSAAKEMMKDFLERERRVQAEREAAKAQKQATAA